jgi:hypothetical protein
MLLCNFALKLSMKYDSTCAEASVNMGIRIQYTSITSIPHDIPLIPYATIQDGILTAQAYANLSIKVTVTAQMDQPFQLASSLQYLTIRASSILNNIIPLCESIIVKIIMHLSPQNEGIKAV